MANRIKFSHPDVEAKYESNREADVKKIFTAYGENGSHDSYHGMLSNISPFHAEHMIKVKDPDIFEKKADAAAAKKNAS